MSIPNIANLPPTDYVNNGAKFIIDNEDGTFLIDYENIIISIDQISFADDINQNNAFATALSAKHDSNMDTLYDIAESPFAAAAMSVLALSSGLSGYNAMFSSVFSGTDVPIPLDYIEVNTFTDQTNSTSQDNAETLSIATSSIVVPGGTYRLKVIATFNQSLYQDYADIMWVAMRIQRTTPPVVTLLKSNVSYSHAWNAQTFDCYINGYFYTCGRTEISLQVSTLAMVALGHEAISVPLNADELFAGRKGDIKSILGYTSIRPVQLTLERLSIGDTLSAVIE